MKDEKNNINKTSKAVYIPNCFGCGKTKNLIKDIYKDTHWCKEHYKERHRIMSDFLDHAMYGT